jgi:hypothetical protein
MQRFEQHYTPEYGFWSNVAEIELSVLERQCLAQRMNREPLEQEVGAQLMASHRRPDHRVTGILEVSA